MISHPAFTVEPWAVTEEDLDHGVLAQSESVFALSNGHIGLRGNLDEGEPFGLPGTYLNGFYETRPLPYAEAGYGYPEAGQTVVNATNGKVIRLLVDDEPLDVRYGELLKHTRTLDLRAGVLRRELHWRSPSGREVEVRSTRLVSFVHRSVAAIRYEVRSADGRPLRVVAQSELVANEPGTTQSDDPRAAAALRAPLVAEEQEVHGLRIVLVHRTRESGLRMAAGMDHVVEEQDGLVSGAEAAPDLGRVWFTAEIGPDGALAFTKFLAYGWSSRRSLPSVRDQVDAAVASARRDGWDTLEREQREYLDGFWARADVEIDGDGELQQAVRFALFHTLQSGARAERRAIAAKGLTGPGYDGHAFWDTETFVLPVLTYTQPHAAADALRWRHSTMDLAQQRAAQLGLKGAAFPWRTIRGQECSAYWPAGTAAFHIDADIADAVIRYVHSTGDTEFEAGAGLELLVETARLWRSLGHHDHAGAFHIDGVTGPDEYSSIADDNVYTNLMAEQNLRMAAEFAARHAGRAQELGVDDEEVAAWRDAAAAMHIPWDERLRVHPQSEGFTRHEVLDLEGLEFPLLLHVPYFQLYRRQVVKQADLVLALFLRGDRFTADEKARDFAYYEAITVRDSSLSACVQAVVAAEVGHVELAYDYFGEAALMDLGDLMHNTGDGLHIASLAGSWIAAVAGFGGLRDHGGELSFRPRLPAALTRLAFRRDPPRALPARRGAPRRSALRGAVRRAARDRHDGEPLSADGGRAPDAHVDASRTPARSRASRRGAHRAGDGPASHVELLATFPPHRPARARRPDRPRPVRRRPVDASSSSRSSPRPAGSGPSARMHLAPAEITAGDRRPARPHAAAFAVNLWVSTHDVPEAEMTRARFDAAVQRLRPAYDALGVDPPPFPERFSADVRRAGAGDARGAPPVLSFVYGVPAPDVLAACRERGIATIGTAITVEEAVALDEAGVDAIVASGFEAGGHRIAFLRAAEDSLIGTLALVPAVADAVRAPVIAAGGIADARGIVAALALGAEAVQIGTAFLATAESAASPAHKALLLEGGAGAHAADPRVHRPARARRGEPGDGGDRRDRAVPLPVVSRCGRSPRPRTPRAGSTAPRCGRGRPRAWCATSAAGELLDSLVAGVDALLSDRSVMSIARIDASSGSLASRSWMIRWTSDWSCPKSSRIERSAAWRIFSCAGVRSSVNATSSGPMRSADSAAMRRIVQRAP